MVKLKKILFATLVAVCSFTNVMLASAQINGTMLSATPNSGFVEDDDDDVIDELWGTPILAYGGSLSPEQLEETKAIFGITNSQFDSVAVTGEDLVRFLRGGNPNANMYSSALITKGTTGSGTAVSIMTPDKITRVTEEQYTNAMITAGITDSIVYVASPVPVTGESALTGIYKAYADRGTDLEQDRMEVAQQELETTSSIANEHAENEDFDSTDLDNALIDIKLALADIKERDGETASDAKVAEVVQDALKKNNLDQIITSTQAESLANFARNFQNTSAIDSAQVREQLEGLANNIAGGLRQIRDAAEGTGLWTQIQNGVSRLVQMARNFFSR